MKYKNYKGERISFRVSGKTYSRSSKMITGRYVIEIRGEYFEVDAIKESKNEEFISMGLDPIYQLN